MPQYHVVGQVRVASKLITEWQINTGLTPSTSGLPTDEKYIGSEAHTPGYAQVWELGAEGWVEL
jgi:hypothetical protein